MSYHGLDPRDWKDEPPRSRYEAPTDDEKKQNDADLRHLKAVVWLWVLAFIVAYLLFSWVTKTGPLF